MRSATRFWLVFSFGALALCAGMGWLSAHIVGLDGAASAARGESAQMDRIRLALWRMDSWLNAQLAPEAARPYLDYDAYPEQQRAYTRALGTIRPGEVLTPSPLLTFRSELFPLHFQLAEQDLMSSPQVPTGNLRDLTEINERAGASIDSCSVRLEALRPFLHYDELGTRLGRAAAQPMNCVVVDDPGLEQVERDVQSRVQQSFAVKNVNVASQQAEWLAPGVGDITPGALLPLWLEAQGAAQLVFARRVDLPTGTIYQGMAVDWDRLRASLLEQITDLFTPDTAVLVRDDAPDADVRKLALATVPARLVVPPAQPIDVGWNATRSLLATAWLALLIAIAAVGVTLGAALNFGQRRARFASAVTHELRSPLTTFQMYSEMLAENMVTDPQKRAEYLRTLCRESDRLARLVENVLAYARIEDGRHHGQRARVDLATLLGEMEESLRRRCDESGFALRITIDSPDAVLDVDGAAVEQILFGLVDNACKYAGETGDRRIDVTANQVDGRAELRVRDHGPGIPAAFRRAVFRPFERGARLTGESIVPGVGLGLALARGLARELDGELALDPTVVDGACFVLRIPVSRR